MSPHTPPVTFAVTLVQEAHHLAKQFSLRQKNLQKAEQVYHNTLAVYAVRFFLKCIKIETNWSASDSWDLLMQTLVDVADLFVPSVGKLECRPVLPEKQDVYIPMDVWSERIGYVIVQLSKDLREATLLGFLKTAPILEEVPLTRLQLLDGLPEHLAQIRQAKMQVKLSQWFEDNFTDGWQPSQAFFRNQHKNLASSVRSKESLLADEVAGEDEISGSKLIDLGIQIHKYPLALVVTVTPITDRERLVLVQVRPVRGKPILPPNVELMVSDETETDSMKTVSRETDNWIQIEFTAELGEQFITKVTFNEASLTQNFLI